MANSFTSIRSKVVGLFDSTGGSDPITVDGGFLVDVDIEFDDFDGTIQLQRWSQTGAANVGAWHTIEEYTSDTAKVFRSSDLRRYRLNCSVATSGGPARFSMAAGNRE